MGKFSLKDLFADGASKLVEKLGDAIDKNVTSKEEREILRNDLIKEINTFQLEFEKLESGDRDSARDLQKAALAQDDKFSKRFTYYLATFWSLAGVSYIFTATYFPILNEKIADTTLGFLLGTIVATIINYFFGSSKGSSDKQNTIGVLMNNNKK
jgi:hypothetical protein